MPEVWKASVYRRQTRTATCLTYGRRVFTGDKQEQPRALCMEGECLQEKQVQPQSFLVIFK